MVTVRRKFMLFFLFLHFISFFIGIRNVNFPFYHYSLKERKKKKAIKTSHIRLHLTLNSKQFGFAHIYRGPQRHCSFFLLLFPRNQQ